MDITNYEYHIIKDPTGIMAGQRYEFLIDIEVEEDDELYQEGGVELRLIFAIDGEKAWVAQHHFVGKLTEKVLEFGLEEDEEAEVAAFCRSKIGN